MTRKFSIKRMREDEMQIAIDWASKEGWNPGLADAHCFYQADTQGFFLGLLDSEPIATASAVAYDEHFAFCGLYIVKPEFRHQQYGIQLTEERLKYVGNRITGLDGVVEMAPKYQRLGYVASHTHIRYALISPLSISTSAQIIDLTKISFNELEIFDRNYFPAPRSAFLRSWITQPHSCALGYLQDQKLSGYGVIRKCFKGYKIGPLFARSSTIAQALFEALCSQIPEGPVYLDIPEPNRQAQLLVKHYKMVPQFEVIRMYRNGFPKDNLQEIYGVTTFELG